MEESSQHACDVTAGDAAAVDATVASPLSRLLPRPCTVQLRAGCPRATHLPQQHDQLLAEVSANVRVGGVK